jgi:hypothetical protein
VKTSIRRFLFVGAAALFAYSAAIGQSTTTSQPVLKPSPTPKPTPFNIVDLKSKDVTAEQVAETAILVYGLGGGRARLDQIRKTTIERGRQTLTAADGKTQVVTFERFTLRGSNLMKEKIRIDQNFPDARYSLIWSDEKTTGLYNTTYFAPREDVVHNFENSIFRGIDGLLRYKENESKIELAGREKEMGVEYHLIDVTDKAGRKTRYWVSAKQFRVMMITWEEGGVKYKRKFYNQNYTQGTLVPSRSVLTADGRVVEETEILSVAFGQKIDEEMFKAS